MLNASGSVRPLRRSKPRIRPGCITCRLRRMKCDETRPGCMRCEKSGRVCDGYEPRKSPKEVENQLQMPRVLGATTDENQPDIAKTFSSSCDSCSRRQVKCDKSRPSCTKCVGAEIFCVYHSSPQSEKSLEPRLTQSQTPSILRTTTDGIQFEPARQKQLDAMIEYWAEVPQSRDVSTMSPVNESTEITLGNVTDNTIKDISRQPQTMKPQTTSPTNTFKKVPEMSPSQSDTTSSEDPTDWESDSDLEDSFRFSHSPFPGRAGTKLGTRSSFVANLTSVESGAFERFVAEFPAVNSHTWQSQVRQHGSKIQPPTGTAQSITTTSSTSIRGYEKRSCADNIDDDESQDSRKRRRDRTPQDGISVPEDHLHTALFACPFRKHDSRKYCIQQWPRCSLKPQKTIARLKAHLYQYHLIQQCLRCKSIFSSEEALDAHSISQDRCEPQPDKEVDGMTRRMKDQIQSRKKPHSGQTEVEKWGQIYRILFPNEAVPNPYFEPILDLNHQELESPNFVGLTQYERYLHREVPNIVRNALEAELNNELQPIETQLRIRIMEIVQEAQIQAFTSFRESHRSNSHQADRSSSENILYPRHPASMTMHPVDEPNIIVDALSQLPPAVELTIFSTQADLEMLEQSNEANELPNPSQLGEIDETSIPEPTSRESLSEASDYPGDDALEHDSALTFSDFVHIDSEVVNPDATIMFQNLEQGYDNSWVNVAQSPHIGYT